MRSRWSRFASWLPLVLVSVAAGCSSLVPGHADSEDLEGEKISVRLLTRTDMQPYAADWKAAFGTDIPDADNAFARLPVAAPDPIGATLATAAAGFAIDYVKKQLEAEAERYEATFEKEVADDKFWAVTSDTFTQRYYGFEIVRTTSKYAEAAPNTEPAFRLVYGISPSSDQAMFRVAPLFLNVHSSRAKVLSLRPWSAIPIFWWHLLLERTDALELSAEVDIDAAWVEKKRGAAQQIAVINTHLPTVQFDQSPRIYRSGDGSLPGKTTGWLPQVPISDFPRTPLSGFAGNFTIKIRVSERDASNAKRYVERAAKELESRRDQIIQVVVPTKP